MADVTETCGEGNTISAQADAMRALSEMNRRGQSRLMVVDRGKLLGVLTLKDVMRFISLKLELEGETPSNGSPHATPPSLAERRREEEYSGV